MRGGISMIFRLGRHLTRRFRRAFPGQWPAISRALLWEVTPEGHCLWRLRATIRLLVAALRLEAALRGQGANK